MLILKTSILTSPSGKRIARELVKLENRVASARIVTAVSKQGCLQFKYLSPNPVQITFYHSLLMRNLLGQLVEIEVNSNLGEHTAFLVFPKQGSSLPVLAFFLDENKRPYYLVDSIRNEGHVNNLRIYPVALKDGPCVINGLTFFRGHGQLDAYINIAFNPDGTFHGAYSYEFFWRKSTLVKDQTKQVSSIVIGSSTSETPLNQRLTGYYGPIKLAPNFQKGRIAYFYFPARSTRRFTLSADDLKKLGITSVDGKYFISAYFEKGLPIKIFNPDDQDFERPIYFRVIRDKNWNIIDVGRERTRKTAFSGIVIVEAIQTSLDMPFNLHSSPVEVCILGRKSISFEVQDKDATRENFTPRPVSVIRVNNNFTLFKIPEPCFHGIAKDIASLAIAAYENRGITMAEEIASLAVNAYSAHKTANLETMQEAIDKLRALGKKRTEGLSFKQRFDACDIDYGKLLAENVGNKETILALAEALLKNLTSLMQDLSTDKANRMLLIRTASIKQDLKDYLIKLGLMA